MTLTRLALSALAVFAVCVFFAPLAHAQASARGYRASVMMPIHAAAPPHARLSLERFQGPPPEARSIAWTRGDLAGSL